MQQRFGLDSSLSHWHAVWLVGQDFKHKEACTGKPGTQAARATETNTHLKDKWVVFPIENDETTFKLLTKHFEIFSGVGATVYSYPVKVGPIKVTSKKELGGPS